MSKVCRICFTDKSLVKIFQENNNLAEKIMMCAFVQIAKEDGYPQAICTICEDDLDFCIKFKQKCEDSDRRLREKATTNAQDNLKLELQVAKIKNHILNTDHAKLISSTTAFHNDEENEIKVDDTPDIKVDEDKQELKNMNSTDVFVCNICVNKFSTKRSLALHMGKKHSEKSQKCDLCSQQFVSKYSLFIHMHRKHNIKLETRKKTIHQCHVCGRIFNYQAELARHLSSHMGIKQFKCNQCDKSFVSKSALTKHLIKHEGIRKFECLLCPKSFTHPSNLQVHLKVHKNEKKYSCNICMKKFKANRTLLLHYKIHTNERNFPCNECDKAFINKYDLLRHLKLHEKKRQIEKGVYDATKDEINKAKNMRQCEHCGKICAGAGDLKKHLRVHSGERPYSCSQCEKTFKSTSTLHCHERTHSEVRPFTCKYCGHGFTQSSNLRTHERLHLNLRPFDCTFCGRAFNRKRDLDNHARKHDSNCTKTVNDVEIEIAT